MSNCTSLTDGHCLLAGDVLGARQGAVLYRHVIVVAPGLRASSVW
jgi:hypothetical protein